MESPSNPTNNDDGAGFAATAPISRNLGHPNENAYGASVQAKIALDEVLKK